MANYRDPKVTETGSTGSKGGGAGKWIAIAAAVIVARAAATARCFTALLPSRKRKQPATRRPNTPAARRTAGQSRAVSILSL